MHGILNLFMSLPIRMRIPCKHALLLRIHMNKSDEEIGIGLNTSFPEAVLDLGIAQLWTSKRQYINRSLSSIYVLNQNKFHHDPAVVLLQK